MVLASTYSGAVGVISAILWMWVFYGGVLWVMRVLPEILVEYFLGRRACMKK